MTTRAERGSRGHWWSMSATSCNAATAAVALVEHVSYIVQCRDSRGGTGDMAATSGGVTAVAPVTWQRHRVVSPRWHR